MIQILLNIEQNYKFICSVITFYVIEFRNDSSKIRVAKKIQNLEKFEPVVNDWTIIQEPLHINFRGTYISNKNGNIPVLDYFGQILDTDHFIKWINENKHLWNTSYFDSMI